MKTSHPFSLAVLTVMVLGAAGCGKKATADAT